MKQEHFDFVIRHLPEGYTVHGNSNFPDTIETAEGFVIGYVFSVSGFLHQGGVCVNRHDSRAAFKKCEELSDLRGSMWVVETPDGLVFNTAGNPERGMGLCRVNGAFYDWVPIGNALQEFTEYRARMQAVAAGMEEKPAPETLN